MMLVTAARSSGAAASLSRITAERSSNAEVKQLAQQILKDQEQMTQEIRQLAERRKTSILPDPDEVTQTVASHLRHLSGDELDREYLKEIIGEQSKMAAKFHAESTDETDAEIREWAERQIPIFQKHLDTAQQLHDKLTAAR
jgi:putative membrane protein